MIPRDLGNTISERLNQFSVQKTGLISTILKITAGVIALVFILFTAIVFQKEIFDWADKPADNASVILIVVMVCYVFSLPVNHKLNKIIDMLEDSNSSHEAHHEEEYDDADNTSYSEFE